MRVDIVRLDRAPFWFVERVAQVFIQEWAWHYEDEWGVSGMEAMLAERIYKRL